MYFKTGLCFLNEMCPTGGYRRFGGDVTPLRAVGLLDPEYEDTRSFEKSVTAYQLTWRNISEGFNLHMGYAVAQLVEALRYKPEGSGLDSRWCHWSFSLT